MLDRGREHYAGALAAAAADLRWSRVAAPLARLAEAPGRARRSASAPAAPVRAPPALRARDTAYIVARTALNAAGRRDWPRVR